MTENELRFQELIDAWREAGTELGIRVIAPFEFVSGITAYKCIACLPDFGGPYGMLVQAIFPPIFARDESLMRDAEKSGYYLSFINSDVYRVFEPEVFQEALTDWGFYGARSLQPSWTLAAAPGSR